MNTMTVTGNIIIKFEHSTEIYYMYTMKTVECLLVLSIQ